MNLNEIEGTIGYCVTMSSPIEDDKRGTLYNELSKNFRREVRNCTPENEQGELHYLSSLKPEDDGQANVWRNEFNLNFIYFQDEFEQVCN